MSALVEASALAIAGRLEPSAIALEAGELVCLIGPNGSGKTSLLHALAAIPPSTGNVRVGGEEPRRLPPERRQRLLSFLAASREIVWPLKARTLIELGVPAGVGPVGTDALGLEPLLDRRLDQLSTGERTRVLIARALAPDPKLLLLDEPIANLDPYWQLSVMAQMKALAREKGKAVLVAIHDLRAALDWADRLVLMAEGRIVHDGTPEHVRSSGLIERTFGVEWTPAGLSLRTPEGPRSSP